MRRIAVTAVALLTALCAAGCCGPSAAQRKAAEDLDRVLTEKLLPRYQAYVDKDADPAHDAAWKDDQKKLADAVRAASSALRDALK